MPPRLTAIRGDIAKSEVDAIVNAANELMLGGGGVDGAIHRAAGPALLAACRQVPEVRPGVRCPTGEARITPGFRLPARWVVHAAGPVRGVPDDARLLASAFRQSIRVALAHGGIRTLAFPAISCGAFGYPVASAARIAASVARESAWALDEIRFVLVDDATRVAFGRALFGDAFR